MRERVEPGSTPLRRCLSRLTYQSLVLSLKLWLERSSIIRDTIRPSGIICRSLRCSPRSHTVSYAAVRSTRTTPTFFHASNLASMPSVRRVTWSAVERPWWKLACYGGSCGSITGSSQVRRRLSSSFRGTQRSEMGR